ERAVVLLHGGQRTRGFWIYARSNVARSGEIAGGNGKVPAARRAAKRCGCTASGSAESSGTGGRLKPQRAGYRYQGSDEEKQRRGRSKLRVSKTPALQNFYRDAARIL